MARGRREDDGDDEVVSDVADVGADEGAAGDVDCAERGSAAAERRAVARASAAVGEVKRAMAENRNVSAGEVPGKCGGEGWGVDGMVRGEGRSSMVFCETAR
jgi:hypothetical protein